MSDNPEFHQCGTCGYEWKHGQHGGHSCADTLSARIASQQAKHEDEIAKWKLAATKWQELQQEYQLSLDLSNAACAMLKKEIEQLKSK